MLRAATRWATGRLAARPWADGAAKGAWPQPVATRASRARPETRLRAGIKEGALTWAARPGLDDVKRRLTHAGPPWEAPRSDPISRRRTGRLRFRPPGPG